MNALTKLWSGIEKNRWTTIIPIVGLIFWFVVGVSCVPTTTNPVGNGVKVNAVQLEQEYKIWLANCEITAKRFEFAAGDIERQQEQWSKIQETLMAVASGNVTNLKGLVGILTTTGLVGFGADNLRKNGVIAGLKRNKKPKKK